MFLNWIYWNPDRVIFRLPIIGHPILWYGLLFALGFLGGAYLLSFLYKRYLPDTKHPPMQFVEKLAIYVITGSVIGARLGHLLFYEKWQTYIYDPLLIFRLWEGGLASHGAIIGIIIALFLFCRKYQEKFSVPFLRLIDLLVIPAAFAGCLIRIGNFINQEVIGKATTLPWAVVFGQPIDGSPILPRHPAQLYEAFFFLVLLGVLLKIWFYKGRLLPQGKLTGLFFVLTFTFRFLVEFVKEHQSALIESHSMLVMGQYLSLPIILLGCYLLFNKKAQRKAT